MTTTTTNNISASTDFRATKFPAIVLNGTYAAAAAVMLTAPSAGAPVATNAGTVFTYTWTTGSGNFLETIAITTAGSVGTVLTKSYRNADGVVL